MFLAIPVGPVSGQVRETQESTDVGEEDRGEAAAMQRLDELQRLARRHPRSREGQKSHKDKLIELGESFLTDFPDVEPSTQVRLMLCEWYAQQKAFKKMCAMAQQFLEKHEDHEQAETARVMNGMALLRIDGCEEEGIRVLKAVVKNGRSGETRAQASFLIAEHLMGNQQFEMAQKYFKEAKAATRNRGMTGMIDRQLAILGVIGKPPKSFKVTGTGGEEIAPEKFHGKVLLIDFWAVWCGPCVVELPNIKKIYKTYHDEGFEIVGVSLDRNRRQFDAFVQKQDMTWPQFYDGKGWSNEIVRLYGVKSIPETYLLDKKGNLRYIGLRGEELEEAVKKLLKEPME